jgi:D-serine deaminase-like pyridoxal phosphate-dependent protein
MDALWKTAGTDWPQGLWSQWLTLRRDCRFCIECERVHTTTSHPESLQAASPKASTDAALGAPVATLDTPAVLIDLDRMERNIRDWQAAMDRAGVRFRPHIKTHKIPEIGLMQVRAGACGIVSAKVSEAEPFAAAGVRDICIAYPVFGEAKWRRIAEMARRGVRITVNCDSEAAARGLAQAASEAKVTINVQVDVDTGMHRGGIPISDFETVERLARTIARLPGLAFDGITTFRSLSYANAAAPKEAGQEEARLVVEVAERLRAKGIDVRNVTAGSSPTGRSVAGVKGITEVRAGTYVFNDLMQLGLGAAGEDQLALTILCTVVSNVERGRLTVDGGSKTFSGDAPTRMDRPAVIARALNRPIFVERLSEEHGVARTEAEVRLGEKIRFVPYHVCTCVNLTDRVFGIRRDQVEVVWGVAARGLRT